MPESERRALRLLQLLHQAPGDRAGWSRFLDALQAEISADSIVLFAAQAFETQPGVVAAPGLGTRFMQLGDFLRPAVQHPGAQLVPLGAVAEVPAGSPMFLQSSLFREVLGPTGIRPGPGLFVVIDRNERHITAATLVLPRTDAWKPRPEDRVLLERLAPHMVLARRVHVLLSQRRSDTEALLSAFDHLVLGVVLLDEDGRVSYVNRSAADALGLAAGFDDERAAEPSDARTQGWRRLVGEAGAQDRTTFVLAHPDDGRPLQLVAAPFGSSDRGVLGGRFARAVFIGDPKRRTGGDPIGVLREVYGLTPGETRLTLLLLSDCSLEESARLLGISRSTARSVLKRVFEKTGTNRQSGLVRLLLAGFAQVVPNAAADSSPPRPAARR